MKKAFPGHFANDPEDLKRLWEDSLISVDANVLLSLYRYSESTRNQFLEVFKTLNGRLWIPHQVAKEYLKNRLKVISDQAKSYDDAIQGLEALRKNFENPKQHPFVGAEALGEFVKSFDLIIDELKNNKSRHDSKINEDDIKAAISDIFDGKVGEGYADQRLEQIIKEGEVRYENKIPPGFKDINKAGGKSLEERLAPYGDYIGWLQLMEKAAAERRNVIYVTGDNKEDWWLKLSGKTLGPLPELIEEFMRVTSQRFYMYPPERFLQLAGEHFKQEVSLQAVEEIRANRLDEPVSTVVNLDKFTNFTNHYIPAQGRFYINKYFKDKISFDRINQLASTILGASADKVSTMRIEAAALKWKLDQLVAESAHRLVGEPSETMADFSDAELESEIAQSRTQLEKLLFALNVMEAMKDQKKEE